MSSAKHPIPMRKLERLEEIDDEEKERVSKKARETIARTHKRKAAIQSADSFTELRGILADTTDEEGRKGTEMLHAAREYDKQKDDEVAHHHGPDMDDE